MTAVSVRRLQTCDGSTLRAVNILFAQVFDDPESYASTPPDDAYLARLLARREFVALVADSGQGLAGALVGYELAKFEQARSEFYIYDLGVADAMRRRGVATALIDAFCVIANAGGGHVAFVQADYEDLPAIALYEKLGQREEVLHFDIPVTPRLR
ncbi:MAG: N-acetyltransferase [Novosphingobium sp.]|uniref:GNAT family N-acetyltransferase n=1 Tax=Novosphingobium sp. TaxID=1874826 RepID=UPI003017C91C